MTESIAISGEEFEKEKVGSETSSSSSWTILCGHDKVEVKIPIEIFQRIPFFVALAESGMAETETKVITKPDIIAVTMNKIIELMTLLPKVDLNTLIQNHIAKTITVYNTQEKILSELSEDEVKGMHYSKFIKFSMLPSENSQDLSDLYDALDQLLLQDIIICVRKVISDGPRGDMTARYKSCGFRNRRPGTCAYFFGGSYGCKYGDKCRYDHDCDLAYRTKVIENSVSYLASKKSRNRRAWFSDIDDDSDGFIITDLELESFLEGFIIHDADY